MCALSKGYSTERKLSPILIMYELSNKVYVHKGWEVRQLGQ
jgi:hypothetical protein